VENNGGSIPVYTNNAMTARNFPNLRIASINVNSLNVSTLGCNNAKTYLKIEGITRKKADVIFLCDVRANQKCKDVEKIMGLTRNGSYKVYKNSTKETRGVAIAIKRNLAQDVKGIVLDRVEENYILLDIVLKGRRMVLGSVYGPNENNPAFYERLRTDLVRLGQDIIIGGDFNTIQCHEVGDDNVDRIGRGRVPNMQNSRVNNKWIADKFLIDPFRYLYPLQQEVSYIPFRTKQGPNVCQYTKSRLDFFLISESMVGDIQRIGYKDRLGADFDHKEITLIMGKGNKKGKLVEFDNTLDDPLIEIIGTIGIYDALCSHLVVADVNRSRLVGNLDTCIRERELLEIVKIKTGENDFLLDRINTADRAMGNLLNELPDINELLNREISCSFKSLYEIAIINLKNKLVARQTARIKENDIIRNDIIARGVYIKNKFGEYSTQYNDECEKLTRFDDLRLKEGAVKFREFLDNNNEKINKAFCKLSKEGGLRDDTAQICDNDGEAFELSNDRSEHIRKYYENLYKKRIDNLLGIEDFLNGETDLPGRVENRKLSEDESDSLEHQITMEELTKSMEKSNFDRSSGWDGISFKVLRKYWVLIGPMMLRMVNETFETGELPDTFKMGLIKMIPKKGDAKKIGDWRPITLLCCGYKVVSGVVATRLEKYLMKVIGRAQKGFLKAKNIHTCTTNIINIISEAWSKREETGIMCVDFSKAFDSIEHMAISTEYVILT
jgi:exonuclease III